MGVVVRLMSSLRPGFTGLTWVGHQTVRGYFSVLLGLIISHNQNFKSGLFGAALQTSADEQAHGFIFPATYA